MASRTPAQQLQLKALDIFEREIARLTTAKLPGLADHIREIGDLIRQGHLAVLKIDDDGMVFQPTEAGKQAGLDQWPPAAGTPSRGQKMIIEEVAGS